LSSHRLLSVIHGPVFGGAHNQLIRLAPALREAGIETVAVVPPEAEAAAKRIEAIEVEVVRMPLGSLRATANPRVHARLLTGLRRDIRRLRGAIRRQQADLVQVHGVINPHAGIAAELEDVAVAWQLLDTRAPMALRRVSMPMVVRIADAITSWGRALAETHPGATRLGDRLVVVFPPVDPALGPDAEASAAGRERLGVAGGAPLVGTVGVRNSQKGHEYFVRAAAVAARQHPDAVFRVIGSPSPSHAGHMRAVEAEAVELGLEIPDRMEFFDPQGPSVGLTQALDVFVISSIPNSEGMPTAILEAMACGKPVVSTDVGAVRELVEEGVTGLVVPPQDPDAIGAAISRLLADPALRERMGAAGRERAEREFRLERLAELHLRAYRAALAHRARR
jgi:glycosyltransferase involved in cell wall biosynthesis